MPEKSKRTKLGLTNPSLRTRQQAGLGLSCSNTNNFQPPSRNGWANT
jgi:hypothetical protein